MCPVHPGGGRALPSEPQPLPDWQTPADFRRDRLQLSPSRGLTPGPSHLGLQTPRLQAELWGHFALVEPVTPGNHGIQRSFPAGCWGGGQASRSGVKRPVTGDPDGAQPGPEPPSSQSPTQVNQGATRPLWTLRVATKTCRAWPGPLLVLWRPESSFPNSDQCRGQVLTPQFMGKLQDKVVTAESGGEGSGLGGGWLRTPSLGKARLTWPEQLQSSQHRREGSCTSLRTDDTEAPRGRDGPGSLGEWGCGRAS